MVRIVKNVIDFSERIVTYSSFVSLWQVIRQAVHAASLCIDPLHPTDFSYISIKSIKCCVQSVQGPNRNSQVGGQRVWGWGQAESGQSSPQFHLSQLLIQGVQLSNNFTPHLLLLSMAETFYIPFHIHNQKTYTNKLV